MPILKPRYTRDNDIRYLNTYCKVLSALGLFPFFDKSSTINLLHVKWKGIFVIVLMVICYVWSQYGRLTFVYKLYSLVGLIDAASYLSLTVANIIICLEVCVFKTKHLIEFLKVLQHVDERLSHIKLRCENDYTYLVELFGFVAFNIWITISYIALVFKHHNFSISKYFLLRQFQYLHVNIIVYLIYNYAVSLARRRRKFNIFLEETFKQSLPLRNYLSVLESSEYFYKSLIRKHNLQIAIKLHLELCRALQIFNRCFGLIILQLAIRFITETTGAFGETLRDIIEGKKIPQDLLVMALSRIVLCWTITDMLARGCQEVCKESKKTCSTCYRIIHDMRNSENVRDSQLVCSTIHKIIEHTQSLGPDIVAARFFIVDRKIVLSLMSGAIYCLLVELQFITDIPV